MTALGLALAFLIIVTLAYFVREATREENEFDRYCSRIDQQLDYEEAERRREESDRGEA